MDMEDLAKYFIREEPVKGLNWLIGSPPNREKLVAELYNGNIQFGEIHQEHDVLTLEIHPEPNGLFWVFELDDLSRFLEEAKHESVGDPPPRKSRRT